MEVPKEPGVSSRAAASAKGIYKYKPLQNASHIRLLKVTPQSTANSGSGELVQVQLEEYSLQQAPLYKALSYTWGTNERPEQITIGHDSHLSVTGNLLAFLVYLCTKKSVFFWIDAICINQDDIQERGSQVRLMRQIYQQAKEVVVWLNQPSFTTFAESIAWNIVKNDKDRRLAKLPLWSLKMFHHPWAMRVWVLQEVVYAQNITIVSQRDDNRVGYITWDEALDFGAEYLDRYKHDNRNTPVDEDIELSIAMMIAMNDWRGKAESDIFNLTLAELLSNTRFCGASDPKDKVFALLALASDVDLDIFQIDYGMSWRNLSVCLARHTISQSNTLDILRWKGLSRPTPQVDNLPSWVPDLSSPALLAPIYPYDWPNRAKLSFEDSPDVTLMCDETSLVVKYLTIHDVLTIAPARMTADHIERYQDMLAVLQQWYQIAREHPSFVDDQKKRIDSFCGTLKMTFGSQGDEEDIEKVYSAGLGWQWHFRKLMGEDVSYSEPEDPDELEYDLDDARILSPENPHLYTPWAREVMFGELDHLQGRSFGFTSDGQMTLLPPGAREDDHICLLYGLQLPFVLRKSTNGCFQVIGACYVHHHVDWDKFEARRTWEQLQSITLR